MLTIDWAEALNPIAVHTKATMEHTISKKLLNTSNGPIKDLHIILEHEGYMLIIS